MVDVYVMLVFMITELLALVFFIFQSCSFVLLLCARRMLLSMGELGSGWRKGIGLKFVDIIDLDSKNNS